MKKSNIKVYINIFIMILATTILSSCAQEDNNTEANFETNLSNVVNIEIAPYSALFPFSILSEGAFSLFGYMDRYGNVVVEPKFYAALPFSEGLAAVGMSYGIGYIDKEGTVIIPPRYFDRGDFQNGVARVSILDDDMYREWFFINRYGEHINEMGFNGAFEFSEGYAAVMIEGRVDPWGRELEPQI